MVPLLLLLALLMKDLIEAHPHDRLLITDHNCRELCFIFLSFFAEKITRSVAVANVTRVEESKQKGDSCIPFCPSGVL